MFDYFGTKIYFPRNSVLFKLVCVQGIYEDQYLRILLKLCQKPDSVFFDVGANIGLLSVPILATNPSAQVVSFEPSPNSLPYLLKTREESKFQNRWTIIQKALSDQAGEVDFSLTDPFTSGLEGMKSTGRARTNRTMKVSSSTLDDEWRCLGKPNVSVIKIDTEGADLLVLRGARECICSTRCHILAEWNSENFAAYGESPSAMFHFANEIGYGFFVVPSFIRIESNEHARLACLTHEEFFLAPLC